MSGAGKYPTKYLWQVPSNADDTTYGGKKKEPWTTEKEVWGSLTEFSANQELVMGLIQSRATAKIMVRQTPDIKETHRLVDKYSEQVYSIDGVIAGDNELTVLVHRGHI